MCAYMQNGKIKMKSINKSENEMKSVNKSENKDGTKKTIIKHKMFLYMTEFLQECLLWQSNWVRAGCWHHISVPRRLSGQLLLERL